MDWKISAQPETIPVFGLENSGPACVQNSDYGSKFGKVTAVPSRKFPVCLDSKIPVPPETISAWKISAWKIPVMRAKFRIGLKLR